MIFVLAIGIAWVLLALPVALLIGRKLRYADRRELAERPLPIPDFIPAHVLTALSTSPGSDRRTR
jgi:hypothetical protein